MKLRRNPARQIAALAISFSTVLGAALAAALTAPPADPRLLELTYDPDAVVSVPVRRGTVTLVVLGADEAITDVASGLGADCARPEAAWCVAAQPGGRTLFVKPKSAATTANHLAINNIAVVTDRRQHSLRFVALPDHDPRPAVYRLVIHAPPTERRAASERNAQHPQPGLPVLHPPTFPGLPALPAPPPLVPPEQIVSERMQAAPRVVNTRYSLAEGSGSQDIVPSLVFDDGRFTYLRFAGNREVPAVFHVQGDGSETLVNARMEDDLLVVDRVSRRLMLRAGQAVVGIWNEAFDLDGIPPVQGTTVPGVRRVLKAVKAGPTNLAAPVGEPQEVSP